MKRNRVRLLFGLTALLGLLLGCARSQNDPIRQVETTDLPQITAASTDAPTATATAAPQPLSVSVQQTATAAATAIPAPTATPVPTDAPTATPTAAPTDTPSPTPTLSPDLDDVDRFLAVAVSMEGKPYLRGGKTEEGFDPGGFVYYCLHEVGVKVSHKSSKGYSEQDSWTKIEDIDAIRAGDLLFFQTGTNESVNCVCICLGSGKMIYPSSSKEEVIITKLHTSYWESAFVFARRVFE